MALCATQRTSDGWAMRTTSRDEQVARRCLSGLPVLGGVR